MEGKSRILVIGATGRLGQELVRCSLGSGHPTFALVREPNFTDPHKSLLLRSFSAAAVTLLKGSLNDYESLVDAVKQVDAVVCAVPSKQVMEQKLLVRAIKEAGCIKTLSRDGQSHRIASNTVSFHRYTGLSSIPVSHIGLFPFDNVYQLRFVPSEFGADPDKVQILDMDHDFYKRKAEIRHLIESEGIPYTYVCCNFFMRYLLPSLVQPGLNTPPRDKIKIFGDGNAKAVFVKERDVAAFTISAIDDPRTLNKVLYLRPAGSVVSMHELAEMWETKIGKKLEKVHISEEELLRSIKETPFPSNMDLIFIYSAFVKGDHTYFSIDTPGLDGTKLYPHISTLAKIRCTF